MSIFFSSCCYAHNWIFQYTDCYNKLHVDLSITVCVFYKRKLETKILYTVVLDKESFILCPSSCGLLTSKQTLHIFVSHFGSGSRETNKCRPSCCDSLTIYWLSPERDNGQYSVPQSPLQQVNILSKDEVMSSFKLQP